MTLRPYQILCAVCSLGGDGSATDERSAEILEAVRKSPDMPITLACNVGEVFAYQDPGTADDTPEGPEFNLKRDLEILYRLNLPPGSTLPARIIFNRLLETIEDTAEICGGCSAWNGCPKASSGRYRKGREKGISAIIPPRDAQEMKTDKEKSLAAMYSAGAIGVRPHILLCALCQYGGGTRPPYPEDNLPELIQLILKKPDTLITMVPHADWMMCAPCPYRAPALNACVNNQGSGGLPNELRDLRVLQKLGLRFGSTLKARDLYRLIFERISGTLEICRLDHARPSVWWSGCGAATTNSENYEKGRKLLMAQLG
jgi:hypothetical protein